MTRRPFKIGTSTSTMTFTEDLPAGVVVGLSPYSPGLDRVVLGDGSEVDIGFPTVVWRFGFLTRAQRNALRLFCPAESNEVYISTRVNNDDAFHDFKAMMIWPEKEDWQASRVIDFVLTFRILETL